MKNHNLIWNEAFQKKHKRSLLYALSKVSLFAGVSKHHLEKIIRFCHIRSYKDREMVFGQGDPAYGIFIVLSGSVDIYSLKGRSAKIISNYGKRSYFGELSFYSKGKRGVSAVANGDSILCYIFKDDLKKLFLKNVELGMQYYENLVTNLFSRLEYADKMLKYERSKHK